MKPEFIFNIKAKNIPVVTSVTPTPTIIRRTADVEQIEQIEKSEKCQICLVVDMNVILVPCEHKLCKECFVKYVDECSICHTKIFSVNFT
jgi:hypothetical protein